MSGGKRFFDTNVLLYLLSADELKADTAEREISAGGVISVQVLNEFTAVAMSKLSMSLSEIREALSIVRNICDVKPISLDTHDLGLQIAEEYHYSIYDSIIVASALLAECGELITEDLQNGQQIESRLTIRNPFS